MRAAVATLLLVACAATAAPRSSAERAAFVREHPCPATGQRRGACPGYVVDHVEPLCAGGADSRRNMQWQAAADALRKDAEERRRCRAMRSKR